MNIEEMLVETFDAHEHLAPDAASVLRAIERNNRDRQPRKTAPRAVVVACAAAAVVVIALGAAAVNRAVAGHRHAATGYTAPKTNLEPTSLVTVETGTLQAGPILQFRAVSDGHLIKNLITAATGTRIGAVWERDGSLLVAQFGLDCRTTLRRLDPTTGRLVFLRTVPEDVIGMALSPDDTRLAYVTYESCPPAPSNLAGPEPRVLVVLDLATGSTQRTTTTSFTDSISRVTWSPDGTQLATDQQSDTPLTRILDAHDPQFRIARTLKPPPGCYYFAPAWTKNGLIVAEYCGPPFVPNSPARLVRLGSDGAVTASWPMLSCIDGFDLAVDPSRVLIYASVGYNGCGSGVSPTTHLLRIDGSTLTPIANFRYPPNVTVSR